MRNNGAPEPNHQNATKLLEMTQRQKSYLYGGILLGVCVVAVTIGLLQRKKLYKSHILGQAQIYHYTIGGRGNAGGVWLDFVFAFNGKTFRSSSRYTTNKFDAPFLNKYFIKKTFPIVYNPDNPTNAHLLIVAEDFKIYGYAYPDSLKFLLTTKNKSKIKKASW